MVFSAVENLFREVEMKKILLICMMVFLACGKDEPTSSPVNDPEYQRPNLSLTKTGSEWNYDGTELTIRYIVQNPGDWPAYNVIIHAEADDHYDSRRGINVSGFNYSRALNPSTVEANTSRNVTIWVPYFPQRKYLTWD